MSGPSRKPMRVAEALATYLERSGLAEKVEAATVVPDWAERVGENIAQVTRPLRVSEGVLFVAVQSSAWLTELKMMEGEILKRLNAGRKRGRIKRIHYVQGS